MVLQMKQKNFIMKLLDYFLTLNFFLSGGDFSEKGIMGLTNLRYICLRNGNGGTITDKSIKTLTNLQSLCFESRINSNDKITGEGIRGLTKLTSLSTPILITHNVLDSLKNLRSLFLNINILPANLLKYLTNLTNLSISVGIDLDSEFKLAHEISELTNLKTLELLYFDPVNDENLRTLTNLTSLKFGDDYMGNLISFEGIKSLIKLRKLEICIGGKYSKFNIEDIRKLTDTFPYLTDFSFDYFKKKTAFLSCEIIRGLNNITKLSIYGYYCNISIEGLNSLTKLSSLSISDMKNLRNEDIKSLTNLTKY
jgi:hypothetical protein